MPVQIPPDFDVFSEDLDFVERMIRDDLRLDITDWAPAIDVLQGKIDAMNDSIGGVIASWATFAGWASNASLPVSVDGQYVNIVIQEAGNYSVMVTLYGSGLETDGIERRFDTYDIINSWGSNSSWGDAVVSLGIEHDVAWEVGDIIELKATEGTVYYAIAVACKEQEGGGTGW